MFYQIHRYPADLIDVLHLPDGQRVVIRPVLPQDEAVTGAFFHDLQEASRYDRFLGPMRSLPPGLLAHLTHVDYSDHLALVAEVFVDDRETIIAEARYARAGQDLRRVRRLGGRCVAAQGPRQASARQNRQTRRRRRRHTILRRDPGQQPAHADACPQSRLCRASEPRRRRLDAARKSAVGTNDANQQQRPVYSVAACRVAIAACWPCDLATHRAHARRRSSPHSASPAPQPTAPRTPAPARTPRSPAPRR